MLNPGRTYEAAVEQFSPYEEIKERLGDARDAAARLLESSIRKKKMIYLYFSNRLEGCAPLTINDILEMITMGVI